MKRRQSLNGFTLVETLIYLIIIFMVLLVVIEAVLIGFRSFARIREEQTVALDATVVLNQLARSARAARTFSEIQPKFYLVDGRLKFNDGDGERSLTVSEIEVTNLVLTPLSSNHSSGIRVAFSLQYRSSTAPVYDFSTTLIMRGSYVDYED